MGLKTELFSPPISHTVHRRHYTSPKMNSIRVVFLRKRLYKNFFRTITRLFGIVRTVRTVYVR